MTRDRAHEAFRMVAAGVDRLGWRGRSWRAECKSCAWVGTVRSHPFDCGPDSTGHTAETGGAA